MKLKPSHRALFSALVLFGLASTCQAQALKMPKKNTPLPNATQSSPSNTNAAQGKLSNGLGESRSGEPLNDGIVAVVNSSIITNGELNRQVATIEQQITRRGVALPDRTTLRQQVLERMVLDKAQLQLATETGIRMDDAQVESAMNGVAQQNNMSLEQFLERIKTSEGISPERFREDVRNELILTRLREREVESQIQVTESEIQAYLASKNQGGQASSGPEVNWVQLLIKAPSNASASAIDQAKNQAADIEKQLRNGARVEDILKARPELAIEGTGAMGWQHYDAVPSLFTSFLTSGAPKSVSTVRSPNGFHVLQVLDRRDGKNQTTLDTTPITQTHARHILIRVSPDVSEAEAKRRLNFVLEQIRGGAANFETLAKRYSQDGSANKGGDLGWLYPGDTVPEFEREMDALKPNGISGVFQSRFGFHIVQVLERRQQAASEERQRQEARQAIRIKKSDESYQEWLRQLRDKTFVDIRL